MPVSRGTQEFCKCYHLSILCPEDENENIRLIKREVDRRVGGPSLANENVCSHKVSESLANADLPTSLLQTEIIKKMSHGNSLYHQLRPFSPSL